MFEAVAIMLVALCAVMGFTVAMVNFVLLLAVLSTLKSHGALNDVSFRGLRTLLIDLKQT